MPAMLMATTNGEALAFDAALVAAARSLELEGTMRPMTWRTKGFSGYSSNKANKCGQLTVMPPM